MRHTILDRHFSRRVFNPAVKADVDELSFFVKNNRWQKTCPFFEDSMHTDIFAQCMRSYFTHIMKKD